MTCPSCGPITRRRLPTPLIVLAVGSLLLGAASLWIWIEEVVLEYMDSLHEAFALWTLFVAGGGLFYALASFLSQRNVITRACIRCGHTTRRFSLSAAVPTFIVLGLPGLFFAGIGLWVLSMQIGRMGGGALKYGTYSVGCSLVGLAIFVLTLEALIREWREAR